MYNLFPYTLLFIDLNIPTDLCNLVMYRFGLNYISFIHYFHPTFGIFICTRYF